MTVLFFTTKENTVEEDMFERFKKWCKTHEAGLTLGGTLAVYAGLIMLSVKANNRRIRRYNEAVEVRRQLITDAVNNGKTILPNPDGSFWVIEPGKAA